MGKLTESIGTLEKTMGKLTQPIGRLEKTMGSLTKSTGRLEKTMGKTAPMMGKNSPMICWKKHQHRACADSWPALPAANGQSGDGQHDSFDGQCQCKGAYQLLELSEAGLHKLSVKAGCSQ